MKKKLKVKKIKDKKEIEVVVQENCAVAGKPAIYIKGQDCKNDCTEYAKPRYYKSPYV